MAGKKRTGARIAAVDRHGEARTLKAASLQVDFGAAGMLGIGFLAGEPPGLELTALGEGVRLVVEAGDELRVRIVADEQLVEPAEVDVHAPVREPLLRLTTQKALNAADKAIAPRKHQLRRWAQAALLGGVAEVTIRLVGGSEGRELNREYRGKDYATNVLTFVYDEIAAGEAPLMGDLVLCVPVVEREAREQGKALEAHFAHLVVHGMLHLQGFDHEDAADAERMEACETEILAGLGFADPYA